MAMPPKPTVAQISSQVSKMQEKLKQNLLQDVKNQKTKIMDQIRQKPQGKESFILFIVANWKYYGKHFEELKLTALEPWCENDYKLILKEFSDSNFMSNPDSNTPRFHTFFLTDSKLAAEQSKQTIRRVPPVRFIEA